MISIYNIKPKFQRLLTPVLTRLHAAGITANQITLSSLVLSLFIGIAFWFGPEHPVLYLGLPIGLFIRMALNALDGMMARTYQQQSKKGELLNELGDVVSDLFVFFPLLRIEQEHLYLMAAFICLSMVNEFAGIMGKVIAGVRRYEGPMGKSDRALVMGLYGIYCFAGLAWKDFTLGFFTAIIFFLVVSTYTRIRKTLEL
jgi:CDP-diacylglycerol--glycerol-3-phosphate 3-phosphatidyltransferase